MSNNTVKIRELEKHYGMTPLSELERKFDRLINSIEKQNRVINSNRKLYKISQATKILGLSTSTIHKLIRNEEINTTSLGGRSYIPQSELDRLNGIL